MRPSDQRLAVLRLAETEPDEVVALTAAIFGHASLPDPDNRDGWLCACLYFPGFGELHARHVAKELVALQQRRAEAGL